MLVRTPVRRYHLVLVPRALLQNFVLTPWGGEQAQGIAAVMAQEGYLSVEVAKESDLTDAEVKAKIAHCDVFMLGTLFQPPFRRWRTRRCLTNRNPMRRVIVTLPGCAMRRHKGKRVSIYPCGRLTTSSIMPQTLTPLSPPIPIIAMTTAFGAAMP